MNTSVAEKEKHLQGPVALLFMEIAFILVTALDIPVARQVIGFIFLTFVPGFAILSLLKVKLEIAEKVVFAAGLSIAFLMVAGLFTNISRPLFGISKPLALIPLMIMINIPVLLFLFPEWRNRESYAFSVGYKKFAAFGFVLCTIVALSIVGVLLVDIPPHNNNLILLFMLIFISVLVGIAVFSKRLVSPEFYPLILLTIAIALLFHFSLFSSYIHGGDIFGEYFNFRLTSINSFWNPTMSGGRIYDMLSVTILPTIYSNILGLEGTWILKIVYPLIFALVPVGVFQLFKSKFSKEIAFFSAFFFASDLTFFTEVAALARQMIGELFFILLFLTIFGKNIKGTAKWLCFCVFSFGLVVSHYALSYIFLILIFVFWLFSFLLKRKMSVNAGMVFTFATMTFAWYIYSSASSTFNDLLDMANNIETNFSSDFLNSQSRGSTVLQATGLKSGVGTFWHISGTYLYYATELLIVIGLLSLLLKQRKSFFKDEYNIMAFLNMVLLVACIVVPNLATSFNATRFYQVVLFFLAPFCVVGGIDVLRFLSRKRINEKRILAIVVLAVIIPFFLFQTDFVYEVAKEASVSLPLSSYRFSASGLTYAGVIQPTEFSGATWLASELNSLNRSVYVDYLLGSCLVYAGLQNPVALARAQVLGKGSFLYLGEYNVIEGTVSDYGSPSFNVTQIAPNPDETSLVYSNGYCEIYQVP